jgi:hypothetical protein
MTTTGEDDETASAKCQGAIGEPRGAPWGVIGILRGVSKGVKEVNSMIRGTMLEISITNK